MEKRKLVVFDLDSTLIDPRIMPISRECHTLMNFSIVPYVGSLPYHVYVRPKVSVALNVCRNAPNLSVALFSAANKDYVYSVLENALFPILDSSFYFDAIYTHDDLEPDGEKNMRKLGDHLCVEDILLVDDSPTQCMAAYDRGVATYNIKAFNAEVQSADEDYELLEMLRHPFFSY
jgi:hypothetical protein